MNLSLNSYMFDNLPNNQKPLSSLTVISCDSSFDSPCNSSSNELSHEVTVKGESGFWDNTGLNLSPCTGTHGLYESYRVVNYR